jgi:hypothetical protein
MVAKHAFPPMEQKLVFGYLKHWYLLRDGIARHQIKPLEEHGDRQLIRYALLYSTLEHLTHVELYLDGEKLSLRGLVARAWSDSKLPTQLLRGVPEVLIARTNTIDKACRDPETLEDIVLDLDVELGEDTSGSAAGSAAGFPRFIDHAMSSLFHRPRPVTSLLLAAFNADLSADVTHQAAFQPTVPRFREARYLGLRIGKHQVGNPLPKHWTQAALGEFSPPRDTWANTQYWSFFADEPGPHAFD